nr:MAG TPA: hypothetical protein [Caudoviricetes sp.]
MRQCHEDYPPPDLDPELKHKRLDRRINTSCSYCGCMRRQRLNTQSSTPLVSGHAPPQKGHIP